MIAPAKDTERTEQIFSCYNKKVTVSSKKSINEDADEEIASPVPAADKTPSAKKPAAAKKSGTAKKPAKKGNKK